MMIKRLRRFSLTVFFLALGLAAPGCSGDDDGLPREAVTGTVTLDGEPFADGSIAFIPAGPTGPTVGGGSAIENGQFSIACEYGLVPGSYNVSINSRVADTTKTSKTPGALPAKTRAESQKDVIPAKYNSKTKLKEEVKKGGPNAFTFDLQSK